MKKSNIVFSILFSILFLSIGRNFITLQKQKNEIENIKVSITAINENIAEIDSNIDEIEKILSEMQFEINEIIYQNASDKTGCPVWVLRGICFAESSYGTNIDHPDPFDKGVFGLHERPSYHAERASKWGEYDAENKAEAARIAGNIIMENYRIMGDMDSAISAYRRGIRGTTENGIDWKYVDKVKQGGKVL